MHVLGWIFATIMIIVFCTAVSYGAVCGAVLLAHWWRALRYSWRSARHLADLTQTEVIPGAEYIPYARVSGSPPWEPSEGDGLIEVTEHRFPASLAQRYGRVGDWREQTRVELAPETLGLLAAPDDPGLGDDLVSSSPSPGPDQTARGSLETRVDAGPYQESSLPGPANGSQAGAGAAFLAAPAAPTRLADTGDLAAAHVAHPSPDWLAAQMADLFAWVRVMVPQVTGWSVGA